MYLCHLYFDLLLYVMFMYETLHGNLLHMYIKGVCTSRLSHHYWHTHTQMYTHIHCIYIYIYVYAYIRYVNMYTFPYWLRLYAYIYIYNDLKQCAYTFAPLFLGAVQVKLPGTKPQTGHQPPTLANRCVYRDAGRSHDDPRGDASKSHAGDWRNSGNRGNYGASHSTSILERKTHGPGRRWKEKITILR